MSTFVGKLEMQFVVGTWTDVSADVLGGVVNERGITQQGASARVAEPGTLRFDLKNSARSSGGVAGYYSPFSTNKRSGFGFNIPVQWSLDGTVQFVGRLLDISVLPGRHDLQKTTCVAQDPIGAWATMPIKNAVGTVTGQTADQLLTTLLSAVDPDYGVLYSASFDTGINTFNYAFDSIRDEFATVLSEVQNILMSEMGWLWMDPTTARTIPFAALPQLRFGSRASRTGSVVNVTLNSTIVALTMPTTLNDLPTRVEVVAHPAQFLGDAGTPVVLYTLGTARLLQPGEVAVIVGAYTDPGSSVETEAGRLGGMSMIAPVATTDYLMNTASDGTGTDKTANCTLTASAKSNAATFTVTNGDTGPVYITKLQVRGVGVFRRDAVSVASNTFDTTANRILRFDMPYNNESVSDGQDQASYWAFVYANPNAPRAKSVRWQSNRDSSIAAYARSLNTGSRIAITESQSGFSGVEFTIQGVRHEWAPSGALWTTWFLEVEELAIWTNVAYSAGNFTGSGAMTWTVDSGDHVTFAYLIIGDYMVVTFWLQTTTVAGTPNVALNIAIPGGKVAAYQTTTPVHLSDNGTGKTGVAQVTAGGTTMTIYLPTLGNWAAATNNTDVKGTITFPIQ